MSSPEKLFVAREKLQDNDIPFQLRVTYYLRISCYELEPGSMIYEALVKVLSTLNPEWLTTCEVTPLGELKSSDSTINRLLLPIEQFYQESALTTDYIPLAA